MPLAAGLLTGVAAGWAVATITGGVLALGPDLTTAGVLPGTAATALTAVCVTLIAAPVLVAASMLVALATPSSSPAEEFARAGR